MIMPVVASWYVENRVGYTAVIGEMTIEDVRKMSVFVQTCMDQGQAPVHIIVDLLQLQAIPKNVPEFIKEFPRSGHPNTGWIIIISSNPALRYLASVAVQLTKSEFQMFATLLEARDFLSNIDLTLK